MRLTSYWVHNPPHGAPWIERRVTKVSLRVWLIETLLSRHPHWSWWEEMWDRLRPETGDPLCEAWLSFDALGHGVLLRSERVGIKAVPERERGWIEDSLLTFAADRRERGEPIS